jgi:hypothetical protein
MPGEVVEIEETDEYYVIPEAAIRFLPEEWQGQLQQVAEDGRAVLKSADNELSQLSRIANVLVTVQALKHIQKRLNDHGFQASMEHMLELDMLTLAFVVTYVRLHQGGAGSGFARVNLPGHLRQCHDEIVEMRNKRFAHNTGHHTITDALQITSGIECTHFEIQLGQSFRVQIGGNPLWAELVAFVDDMFADRMDRLLKRISAKTGRQWSLQAGEPPE